MRPNSPDHLPLRQRAPRRLIVESGALMNRGLAELRPRRLSYPKLAATAVRQMAFKSLRHVQGATVLMPMSVADADQTLRLLADIPSLTLGAPVFPAFLDALHTGAGRRILAVLGDGETPRAEAHAPLSRSLAAHDAQIEQRLAQELHARIREGGSLLPAGIDRESLVVEERPGKATLLGLADATARISTKKWQALASRTPSDAARPPTDAPEGWGVGALVLADEGDLDSGRHGRLLTLASFDVQLAGDTVNLDTGRAIREVATAWLRAISGPELASFRRVVLSVPAMPVAAVVGASFAGPLLSYPDFIHGWQPFLSLIELLYQQELPALFVYTGRYPEVHLVAVWS